MINNIIKPFDYSCMEDGIATVCLNEGEYRTDFSRNMTISKRIMGVEMIGNFLRKAI